MGAQLGGSDKAMSDMNLTPLIDIVLVVLIIMMVNIPITVEQMGVKLPSNVEVENKSEVPPEQLVIAIYEDGLLALSRRAMSEDRLVFELSRRLRSASTKQVFIDAHPEIVYGRVVDMMDLARGAGASKVGLARLKPEGPVAYTSVARGAAPRGVFAGTPRVVGAMKVSTADRQIQPFRAQVDQTCYRPALARNASLTGQMTVRFSIAPDGTQMAAELVGDSVDDAALKACIEELLPSVHFEPLVVTELYSTALVNYNLVFSPG